MKWVALGSIVLGMALVMWAVRRDSKSSFDDGSFLLELLGFLGGGVMVVLGGGIFVALIFLNL